MTFREQWIHRPQSHWLRKAVFQVHLWAGIALGLYAFVVCFSGSLAVFNSELYTAFLPQPRMVPIVGTRLAGAKLRAAAQRAYPAATVTRVTDYHQPGSAVVAYLGGRSECAPEVLRSLYGQRSRQRPPSGPSDGQLLFPDAHESYDGLYRPAHQWLVAIHHPTTTTRL